MYVPKSEKIQSVKSHGSLHQTSDFRRWSEAALGDHGSHLSFDRVEGQISNWMGDQRIPAIVCSCLFCPSALLIFCFCLYQIEISIF